jgi:alpha-tubulin suppressor-like RCC1 family protein
MAPIRALSHLCLVLVCACGARTALDGSAESSHQPTKTASHHLALGDAVSCALVAQGVYCWGTNGSGELGVGTADASMKPVATVGLSTPTTPLSIASGGYHGSSQYGTHTCAILVDGSVACWGENIHGNYPDNVAYPTLVPTAVGISSARALAVSEFVNCALVEQGSVECWGSAMAPSTPRRLNRGARPSR